LQNLYRDPLGSIRAWQRSRIRFEKHGDRSLSIPGMVSVSKDPSYFRSLRIDERFFSFHPLAQSALDAVHCPLSNINSAKRRIFVARKFLTNSLRNSLSLSLSLSLFPFHENLRACTRKKKFTLHPVAHLRRSRADHVNGAVAPSRLKGGSQSVLQRSVCAFISLGRSSLSTQMQRHDLDCSLQDSGFRGLAASIKELNAPRRLCVFAE